MDIVFLKGSSKMKNKNKIFGGRPSRKMKNKISAYEFTLL